MAEEFEMEDMADMAISECRTFIDTENQFIIEEHMLLDTIGQWESIIGHIDERIEVGNKLRKIISSVK